MAQDLHAARTGVNEPGDAPGGVLRIAEMRPARALAEEVPVAIVCNGATQAVMMATPADLGDFAIGFLRTEGLSHELPEVERIERGPGVELRVWLNRSEAARLAERRRAAVGPVGCGLCGIESLAEAVRPAGRVLRPSARLSSRDIIAAESALRAQQPLHWETGATHAAGFYRPGAGMVAVREDVGRHNALDKLVGALLRLGADPTSGAVVLTSRVSVDMVQKTAALGCPLLLAVSAPTRLAVETAEAAAITLVANLRGGAFRTFTHPGHIEE